MQANLKAPMVDSTGYVLEPEDSVFTLNLLLPRLDNGNPENWELTSGIGSPGAANEYYLHSSIQGKRSLFMQTGGIAGLLILGLVLLRLRRRGYL